ncbi:hypothetical protein B6U74_06515, partial [Candidatus Bathyarchaeota archaeon ex4484_205]
LVYSLEGHAVRYKVEKVDKGNRSVGMLLKDPVQYRVPENISYFRSVDFRQYLYLAVAQDTIYELNYHTLSVLKKRAQILQQFLEPMVPCKYRGEIVSGDGK